MDTGYTQIVLQSQIEIQEHVLAFINKEICDNIGQILSVAKLNLGVLDITEANAKAHVFSTKDLIGQAIKDLRYLCKSLDSHNMAQIGLPALIEQELERIQKTTNLPATFINNIGTVKLKTEWVIVVFRMIQEMLDFFVADNTCTAIYISLSKEKQEYVVTISNKSTQKNTCYRLINSNIFTSIISKGNVVGINIQIAEPTDDAQYSFGLHFIIPINS